MLQTIKWFFGQPVVNRARRLARAFLDQTLHAPAVQRQLLLDQIARNADSQFGRPGQGVTTVAPIPQPSGPGLEVLCVNPAAPAGGSATLS
ncbi:MAG: hypothetical protein ABSE84_24850, partial [Isosphaeraceae bacterium]